MSIQLIAGLGNPGTEYNETRHNAGAWLVAALAQREGVALRIERKFHGSAGILQQQLQSQSQPNNKSNKNNKNQITTTSTEAPCRLLIPTTFMNHSGLAIKTMASFYRIPPEAILVVHDDLDLLPGIARLKYDGGHGGHNGLQNTIQQLGSKQFYRLRLGIGHPGDRDKVIDYVLQRPSRHDKQRIDDAIDEALAALPLLLAGQIQQAMQQLHSK